MALVTVDILESDRKRFVVHEQFFPSCQLPNTILRHILTRLKRTKFASYSGSNLGHNTD